LPSGQWILSLKSTSLGLEKIILYKNHMIKYTIYLSCCALQHTFCRTEFILKTELSSRCMFLCSPQVQVNPTWQRRSPQRPTTLPSSPSPRPIWCQNGWERVKSEYRIFLPIRRYFLRCRHPSLSYKPIAPFAGTKPIQIACCTKYR
jgi:hypothetical protein